MVYQLRESKRAVSITLMLLHTLQAFFGFGEMECFHCYVTESRLNLLDGFHLTVAQFPAKFNAVALLQSFRHFPYNEKPKRELNITSFKCCLPLTDGREKIHTCV